MRRILLLLAGLLFTTPIASSAQAPAGAVTGRVVGEAQAPVPGAAVALVSVADSTLARTALTDAEGRFRVQDVTPGTYRLRVSRIGYQEHGREAVAVGPENVDLGLIRLSPAVVALEGLEVQGERSAVTVAADRTIYSVKDMPAVTGGFATDALRSVPELDVDVNGKVRLRGTTPTIHINGRPTPMRGEALDNFLQQLPADRIDRVEVMPNPSAKYEAEGAGGIVNIVLKDDADLGLSGSLGLTTGTRGRNGGFGNFAYQEGRLTMFGSSTLNFHRWDGTHDELRSNLLVDPVTHLHFEGSSLNRGHFRRLDLTAEYRVTENTTAWSNFGTDGYGSDGENLSWSTAMDALMVPTEISRRVSESSWGRSGIDYSLGLKHVFEKDKHELSAEVRRSDGGSGNDGDFSREVVPAIGAPPILPPELTVNDRDEDEDRLWVKLDYTRPVGPISLETGVQVNRQETVTRQYRESTGGAGGEWVRSDGLDFRENFTQAYLTANGKSGRVGWQGGVRLERAETELALPTTRDRFERSYTSLFPSANAYYDFGSGRRAKVSYSRRIQRPYLWFLNPVDWSMDPLTSYVGNPYLLPQYTHSASVELSWSGEVGTIRFSPYHRRTDDDWGRITRADASGRLTRTWENLLSVQSWGTNTTLSLDDTGRLSGSLNLTGWREIRDADNLSSDLSGSHFRYNGNANLSVRVSPTLVVQGMLWYQSPHEVPQGRASWTMMTNVGVRKQLFEKKVTVNLRLQDPFELYRYRVETRDRTYAQTTNSRYSQRSLSLSVSYNFGRRPQSARRPGNGQEGEGASPQPAGPMM